MDIQEISATDHAELLFDMPLSTPRASSMEEAFGTPGCGVKSNEQGDGGWPAYFGRLLTHNDVTDHVVVISYPGDKPIFKWEGTVSQYHSTWRCD